MSQLNNVLNERIEGNKNTIKIIEDQKPENQKTIELFDEPTKTSDNKIISLISDINTAKGQIAILSQSARAAGCGTTVGVTTIYPDVVRVAKFNTSSSTYNGDSPFSVTTQILSSSNSGIGTKNIFTQSDSSQSSIGSLYADIGTCYDIPCTVGCGDTSIEIQNLQTLISNKQSEIQSMISNINDLKYTRHDWEIERYSFNKGIQHMNNKNTQYQNAINIMGGSISTTT